MQQKRWNIMQTKKLDSRNGFTTLELIGAVIVVAAIAAVVIIRVLDSKEETQTSSNNRNVQVLQDAYERAKAQGIDVTQFATVPALGTNLLTKGILATIPANIDTITVNTNTSLAAANAIFGDTSTNKYASA
jgi:type II secretory pathway pseudopilin PulG